MAEQFRRARLAMWVLWDPLRRTSHLHRARGEPHPRGCQWVRRPCHAAPRAGQSQAAAAQERLLLEYRRSRATGRRGACTADGLARPAVHARSTRAARTAPQRALRRPRSHRRPWRDPMVGPRALCTVWPNVVNQPPSGGRPCLARPDRRPVADALWGPQAELAARRRPPLMNARQRTASPMRARQRRAARRLVVGTPEGAPSTPRGSANPSGTTPPLALQPGRGEVDPKACTAGPQAVQALLRGADQSTSARIALRYEPFGAAMRAHIYRTSAIAPGVSL